VLLGKHSIKGFGLAYSPRVAVHDESFRSIIALKVVADQIIHQIIRNELAADDKGLGSLAGWCVASDGFAKDVARANVLQIQALAEQLGLRPLSAPRWSIQDQSHGRPVRLSRIAEMPYPGHLAHCRKTAGMLQEGVKTNVADRGSAFGSESGR
jgi:hypothetical protein